jgi:hypothetical protein
MWNRIGRTNAGAVNQSPLASRVPRVPVAGPPPEVVTAGLILNFDAATYSGTGDWVDSIGGTTFPLDNAGQKPGINYYSAFGGGSFEFSKFSNSASTTAAGGFDFADLTIEMWYYHIPGSIPSLSPDTFDGSTIGWRIGSGPASAGSANYFLAGQVDSSGNNQEVSYGPLVAGTWYQLVAKYEYNLLTIYVNGNNVGSTSLYGTTNLFNGPITLMNSQPGSVAIIRSYNRVLTDAEVLQNYNAVKNRFTKTPSTVITTGLVNYFDAAPSGVSPTKYSGVGYDSSGVWKDQVGTADITLYNSPAYDSSTNGGLFTFNRTLRQYGASGSGAAINTNAMTVEIWTQSIAGYGGAPVVPFIANIFDNNNYPWLIRNTTAGANSYVRLAASYVLSGSFFNSPILSAITANTWYQIVLRKSGGTGGYMYVTINGCINSTGSITYNYTDSSAGQLVLMTSDGSSAFRGGKMALVRTYNTRLSDAEVLQNYNATKARFGLA